ncbi:MAG: energy-converting hydrogenase B subunit G, EhbG [Methanobacteriaceae archaeon]|nr:energy-converting hydrogenase B subunit G, EhbG [Methanobacteriaceae archaeon]
MNIYDVVLKRIREIQTKTEEQEPLTNISASSTLAAEITLISSLLIALVMLRLVNTVLMIVIVLAVFVVALTFMPIMPRLKREQNDSFNSMIFFVIVALGIIITLFYWGNLNV